MPWPPGVSVGTVTFGPYRALDGSPRTDLAASISVTRRARHLPSGAVLLPAPEPVPSTGPGEFAIAVPHSDGPGIVPTGVTYRVDWRSRRGRPTPATRTFLFPLAAGAVLSYDSLAPTHGPADVLVPVIRGEPGPPGPPGSGQGVLHRQDTAAATWIIDHEFTRPPLVALYIEDRQVWTDLSFPSPSRVVVHWPEPTAGQAYLL